jgi:multicomponent Na+:H+ antiporter subunit F
MMTTVALVLLAASAVIFMVRAVIGPSVIDRVIAVDSLLVVTVSALAVHAAATGRATYIDVAVVVGLLGFVGTGVAARFIEQRGA